MKQQNTKHTVTLFLCDIRSVHNAGAIMRTAEAAGVDEMVFGGYTPGPLDRFGRPRKDFTKASLGAEHFLPWRCVIDPVAELKRLKKAGACLVMIEQDPRAIPYTSVRLPKSLVVIVLGNEVAGIPKSILTLADTIAELPMQGRKESLNVSVAAGIVLYRWLDCR